MIEKILYKLSSPDSSYRKKIESKRAREKLINDAELTDEIKDKVINIITCCANRGKDHIIIDRAHKLDLTYWQEEKLMRFLRSKGYYSSRSRQYPSWIHIDWS